ncbi:MFS transporter [Streptomyces abyssomicinicus]|uniref:MFS transporter n=1 Tax=Streptomyces abyssomicinicus TaxID=574929 RepID=UPI0013DEDA95|nr:MFS transporter [Streptomyces abyssomicinicus]
MSRASTAPRTPLPSRFWIFWSCLTAGSAADGMTLIALTWAASTVTDSALAISLVAMAERLPWLLFALPMGAVVDRLPRIGLMATAGAARAVAMLALGGLLLTSDVSIGLLAAFALFFGTTEVAYGIAADTAVPLLAPGGVAQANGHVRASQILSNDFVGRPLGGLLLKAGLAVPFLGNALLNGASAGLLLALRRRMEDPSPPSARDGSTGAQALDGLRLVRRDPLLRLLAGSAAVLNTLYAAMLAGQVLFVRESLGLGSLGYALLLSAAAVGGVAGSQYARRLLDRLGAARSLLTALLTMAVCFLGVGFLPTAPVVVVLYATASAAVAFWSVSTLTLRQLAVGSHVLGRVNATFRMVTFGMSVVGMLLGGVLVEAATGPLGPEQALRVPYWLAGALYLLLLVFLKPRLTAAGSDVREEGEPDGQDTPSGR